MTNSLVTGLCCESALYRLCVAALVVLQSAGGTEVLLVQRLGLLCCIATKFPHGPLECHATTRVDAAAAKTVSANVS